MTVKIIIEDETAGEFETAIHGDVTGDGNVDMEDAQAFLEYLVGNKVLTGAYSKAVESYDNKDSAVKSLRSFLNFMSNPEK